MTSWFESGIKIKTCYESDIKITCCESYIKIRSCFESDKKITCCESDL